MTALLLSGAGFGYLLLTERPPAAPPAAAVAAAPDARTLCGQHIADVRRRAASLPADDLTRRYAETDLDLAIIENNGGEVDDCHELAERAAVTLATHPYALRPGETLDPSPSGPARE